VFGRSAAIMPHCDTNQGALQLWNPDEIQEGFFRQRMFQINISARAGQASVPGKNRGPDHAVFSA
jgi:hypothetical protein